MTSVLVDHAHWGLVALSFAIGLVLTLTLMVRRVKHQVPVPTSMGELGSESGTLTTTIPVTEEPPTTIPVAEESPTTTSPVAPYAPFGPGSARARADGSGPAGWLVKGRSDTRLYYTPDDPTYDSAVAQVWFKDEESAKRAYFTPWRKSSRK
ncbi:channel accessory protein ArfC, sunset domain variant [Mycobacterium haemophilum]|uniref:Membrane protein ArfC n=1 Tax=Mycobacterium haemophilum TaxID=29311 RepID=A0A0I9VH26_9MYCO|nr:hypothetical protein [Mycobacterium haemophilum]KLO32329.1 hypothetical protein ABH39_06390 [Mycobacterium haemophilum]KLO38542.1 hypothetical protein ABH38_03965 [Mycobacterium haemophilum]KLO44877.1 hypothetical protein ABH37_02860 [Mycobacterium haemophilum]KLO56219.1 hypothetical protein ABH36_02840 [Mycobacterium haemophilum]